jgi:hypothetical protein
MISGLGLRTRISGLERCREEEEEGREEEEEGREEEGREEEEEGREEEEEGREEVVVRYSSFTVIGINNFMIVFICILSLSSSSYMII